MNRRLNRELIIAEFISLDNVIQAPGSDKEDTEGGFAHGGWTIPIGTMILVSISAKSFRRQMHFCWVRKTWQIHGSAFEVMDGDPFADAMNAINKYVVSATIKSAAAWRNSTLISANVIETIRRLKQQPGKNILVDGSSVLAPVLAQNDLVDEYCLHVYPIVLGSGKRLFREEKGTTFNLVEVSQLPTGVVYMRYRRDSK